MWNKSIQKKKKKGNLKENIWFGLLRRKRGTGWEEASGGGRSLFQTAMEKPLWII